MKHFDYPQGFATYEEAVGSPDALSSAIGYVAIKFSWLERSLTEVTQQLLKLDPSAAAIIAAEASFRAKVNYVGALGRLRIEQGEFCADRKDPLAAVAELAALCFRAEEYRNQVMHSVWELPSNGQIVRNKDTARARNGLRSAREVLSPDAIIAIAEFISNVEYDVIDFFAGFSAVEHETKGP